MTDQLVWEKLKRPRTSKITRKFPGFYVFITSVYKVPWKIFPICFSGPLEKTIELKH